MHLRNLTAALRLFPVLLAGAACAVRPFAPELARVAAEEPAAPAEAPADALPMRPPRPLDEEGIAYVLAAQPGYPRVRYLDGQLSLNESCAIRVENKLSRKIPPVYVNGQPIGFC